MNSLEDRLKIATIEDLKQININMLNNYARINKITLTFLYNHNIIDNLSIEEALKHAVFKQARYDFRLMITKDRDYPLYADNLGEPACLVYALKKDKFSKKEIKQINFDHKNTAETFIQMYNQKNLLSNLRERLLNPEPFPEFDKNNNPY